MWHANYQRDEDGRWKLPRLPFVLIGKTLSGSKIAAMHNNLYRVMNLNWAYSAIECDDIKAARFQMDLLRMGHYRGMNIEFPYKRLAILEADYVDPLAQAAGGANVLVREESHLCAYNTEGMGALLAYERQANRSVSASSICVCGTGILARSVASAALQLQANDVVLFSRDANVAQNAKESIEKAYSEKRGKITPADYSMFDMLLPFCDIFINAEEDNLQDFDEYILNSTSFSTHQSVLDIRCQRGKSALIRKMEDLGIQVFNGIEMTVEQAALSVKIWARVLGLDFEIDRDALRTVIKS